MTAGPALSARPKLAANIVHFARALRRAGLPVGPGRVIDAVRAVEAAGFTERADFYWTLHACFVTRPEDQAVFAQCFRMFWRNPAELETLMAAMMPALSEAGPRTPEAAESRAAEALLDGFSPEAQGETRREEAQIDAAGTASAEERLRRLDFAEMTNAELAEARRMVAQLRLPVPPILARRRRTAPYGRVDRARTLRAALRRGGEVSAPLRTRPRTRWPNLVVLCDISGSMSRYSRMILHFVHAVANANGAGWAQVHAFTFATRLTNITRHMRHRDVDEALSAAASQPQDWEGGTRIGECLHAFNRDWSRRVMGQGAVVLLVSDGLERGDPRLLAAEAERLHLSARQVIWLNPLLAFDGFVPRARGIVALLPHVDRVHAGHSIASLTELGQALSRSGDDGDKSRLVRALSVDRAGNSPPQPWRA